MDNLVLMCIVAAIILVVIFLFFAFDGQSLLQPQNTSIDQQLGLIIYSNTSSLAYNITAVAQTDRNGTGPAYLINALSNNGNWYQLGLTYNWSSYNPGFWATLSIVENYTGNSSLESNCSGVGYAYPFSWYGKINSGDKILMKMNISNGTLEVFIKDWNTSAETTANFNASGATEFVGGSPPSGFFTGLMTEEYRLTSTLRNQSQEIYQPVITPDSNVSLFADEFSASCSSLNYNTFYNLNSSIIPYTGSGYIDSNGVYLSYTDGTFVTGG